MTDCDTAISVFGPESTDLVPPTWEQGATASRGNQQPGTDGPELVELAPSDLTVLDDTFISYVNRSVYL